MRKINLIRHSGERRNPVCKHSFKGWFKTWIPAFAGMTLLLVVPCFAEGPHAFPVPFTPGKDPTQRVITFVNFPGNKVIKVYSVDGHLVAEVPVPPTGIVDWPVVNKSGEKVATGVYIYEVDGTTGKIVVIR